MKVQNTQHFEDFSLIQNNPSGASRHLPLHKGGFDSCEDPKIGFIDTLKPPAAAPRAVPAITCYSMMRNNRLPFSSVMCSSSSGAMPFHSASFSATRRT